MEKTVTLTDIYIGRFPHKAMQKSSKKKTLLANERLPRLWNPNKYSKGWPRAPSPYSFFLLFLSQRKCSQATIQIPKDAAFTQFEIRKFSR